jgi:hypothetical protein
LIAQGAVRIDGIPVTEERIGRDDLADRTLQVGTRRFVRFEGDG